MIRILLQVVLFLIVIPLAIFLIPFYLTMWKWFVFVPLIAPAAFLISMVVIIAVNRAKG